MFADDNMAVHFGSEDRLVSSSQFTWNAGKATGNIMARWTTITLRMGREEVIARTNHLITTRSMVYQKNTSNSKPHY